MNSYDQDAPAASAPFRWQNLLRTLLSRRGYVLALAHLAIFVVSYAVAYEIRFDLNVPANERRVFWYSLAFVLIGKLLVFQRFGSLRGWWRYVTFADLTSLLRVATLSTLVIAAVDYFIMSEWQIPRMVLLLDWGGTILFLGGLRSACRLFREEVWRNLVDQDRQCALMIGASNGGLEVAKQIHGNANLNFHIVGFLDNDPSHRGSQLGGIPFLGEIEKAAEIAHANDAQDLLIIANSISGPQLRQVMEQCRSAKIHVRMIPSVDHWLKGGCRLELREVDIDDLLRRDPVQLDTGAIDGMVRGKCVMVTGAGGSIGSEICRQLLQRGPRKLMLVERSENALFNIDRELKGNFPSSERLSFVGDISDKDRMNALFQAHRPELVFHAAAHKHVPLMEENPGEAIKNNVLGTAALVDMSQAHGVERFVMISTDKAVNPTSIMGASKHLAECYVHAAAEKQRTKFVVVRFGNVLASSGSVVPIFQEQIRRGGPVTVTDPAMERFFMTIPEASQLVLQAAAMGKGGEIFVLDMGNPVKILDLAKDLIRLSGFSEEEIPIEIVGIRPGEKMYEELYFEDEEHQPTVHAKVRVALHRPHRLAEVQESLLSIAPLVHGSQEELRAKLRELVPEYHVPDHFKNGSLGDAARVASNGVVKAEAVAASPHALHPTPKTEVPSDAAAQDQSSSDEIETAEVNS